MTDHLKLHKATIESIERDEEALAGRRDRLHDAKTSLRHDFSARHSAAIDELFAQCIAHTLPAPVRAALDDLMGFYPDEYVARMRAKAGSILLTPQAKTS